jgi:outer membrane protein OmpA-like peptidoglycan-associated protein/tetratricopeptide (TPR) repeat protein
MNIIKLFFVAVFATLACNVSHAQFNKLKRANQFMESLNYQEAIQLYNEILQRGDDSQAKMNIAKAYRMVNDTENAEYWYGQVVRLPESKAVHKLYYGQMLQRNGKCDLAKEWYQKYVDENPTDMRGQYLVKACDYETELRVKSEGMFDVQNIALNSGVDDFGPMFFEDGLVFASERDKGTAVKRTHGWTGNPFLELYYVKAEPVDRDDKCGEHTYSEPEKFSKDLNSKFHDAAVAISGNGDVYFTRNNYSEGKVGKSDDGIVKLKVYYGTLNDERKVKELNSLPFNSNEYSVAHPTLTNDGNLLYFASDMPGGFGGMDLYYSEKQDGRWGPPMNIGPDVNTEGNEIFPYWHEGTKRLYFSSDGLIGLGGLDIYYIEKSEGESWGAIENIGYPINTISDDFSIVFNEEGTCGYLSSDRDGGVGGDDIYSFRKMASPVKIFVYDEDTREGIAKAMVINGCTGDTLFTAEDGYVTVDQKMNACCTFSASKEEYDENAKEGCTKDIEIGEEVLVEIPLKKELEFILAGATFDALTSQPLEGVEVTLTNDCGDEVQTVVTDELGVFSFPLKEDCCYTVKGVKDDYLSASASDQCTRGLTESMTLQVNLNLQPAKMTDEIASNPINYDPVEDPDDLTNRQGQQYGPTANTTPVGEGLPFLVHIYYDFNQSFIREDAKSELDKLLQILVDNEKYIVEIGSHTDSRGSHRYNRRLSQRRAESVVRWLTKRGVSRERLVAVGYGETVNVNNCKNLIPCSEKEHQLNRRTEFKVIGKVGDADFIENSKPNPNARVDVCVGCPF